MGQDLLRLAADQDTLHAPPAVRGLHDEVATVRFFCLNNGLMRMIVAHVGSVTRDARFLGRLFDYAEIFLSVRSTISGKLPFRFLQHLCLVGKHAEFGASHGIPLLWR